MKANPPVSRFLSPPRRIHLTRLGLNASRPVPFDKVAAAVTAQLGRAYNHFVELDSPSPMPTLHLLASRGWRWPARDALSFGLLALRLWDVMKLRLWGWKGATDVHAVDLDAKGDPAIAVRRTERALARLGFPGVTLAPRRPFSAEVYIATVGAALDAARREDSWVPPDDYLACGTFLVADPKSPEGPPVPLAVAVDAYRNRRKGEPDDGVRKLEVKVGVTESHAHRVTLEVLVDAAAYLVAYLTLRFRLPTREPPGHWAGAAIETRKRRMSRQRWEILRALAPVGAGPPFPRWHARSALHAEFGISEPALTARLRGLAGFGAVDCVPSCGSDTGGPMRVRITDLGLLLLARVDGRPDPAPFVILGPFHSKKHREKGTRNGTRKRRDRGTQGGAGDSVAGNPEAPRPQAHVPPYGLVLVARDAGLGRHAEPDPVLVEALHPVEALVLDAIVAARNGQTSWLAPGGRRESFRAIAHALNAAGVGTRSGGAWSGSTVRAVFWGRRAPKGRD